MLNPREEVLRLLNDLPSDCTYEDIQYHIYVRQKIERGLRELEQGRVIAQDEAEHRLRKWLVE